MLIKYIIKIKGHKFNNHIPQIIKLTKNIVVTNFIIIIDIQSKIDLPY